MLYTEAEKMALTWFGEIFSGCSLTVLLGSAWGLLNYVLQTIFSGPVLCKGASFCDVRTVGGWRGVG